MSDREPTWHGFQVPSEEAQPDPEEAPTIGKNTVRAEVVRALTRPGGKVVLAVGAIGMAKRLYSDSDRVMFITGAGQRTIVPLDHLRVLQDESSGG
jgi:hypothetical protein